MDPNPPFRNSRTRLLDSQETSKLVLSAKMPLKLQDHGRKMSISNHEKNRRPSRINATFYIPNVANGCGILMSNISISTSAAVRETMVPGVTWKKLRPFTAPKPRTKLTGPSQNILTTEKYALRKKRLCLVASGVAKFPDFHGVYNKEGRCTKNDCELVSCVSRFRRSRPWKNGFCDYSKLIEFKS
ncbi:Protein of unknown function [Gryllus bimaculatus]|nr:Protein of unknown function [Gryllus bimaculatus]